MPLGNRHKKSYGIDGGNAQKTCSAAQKKIPGQKVTRDFFCATQLISLAYHQQMV
jgi:hypothetical protein